MLKLLLPNTTPVNGYRFEDPDTGFAYNSNYTTFEELEQHVKNYRSQNRLAPIENFRLVWENWVCQEPHMQKKCCPIQANVRRSFTQYYRGGKVWIKTKLEGIAARFVKKEVATARAANCLNCRANVVNTGHTMARYYTDKFMQSQVGKRKTIHDDKIFTCHICSCLLRSKIHYPATKIADSLTKTEIARLQIEPRGVDGRPHKCWQVDAIQKVKEGTDKEELE